MINVDKLKKIQQDIVLQLEIRHPYDPSHKVKQGIEDIVNIIPQEIRRGTEPWKYGDVSLNIAQAKQSLSLYASTGHISMIQKVQHHLEKRKSRREEQTYEKFYMQGFGVLKPQVKESFEIKNPIELPRFLYVHEQLGALYTYIYSQEQGSDVHMAIHHEEVDELRYEVEHALNSKFKLTFKNHEYLRAEPFFPLDEYLTMLMSEGMNLEERHTAFDFSAYPVFNVVKQADRYKVILKLLDAVDIKERDPFIRRVNLLIEDWKSH